MKRWFFRKFCVRTKWMNPKINTLDLFSFVRNDTKIMLFRFLLITFCAKAVSVTADKKRVEICMTDLNTYYKEEYLTQ